VNFIELFAGCGGLSLGLKSVGFELVMANELSPMAAETYAYNFFKEDLQAQALTQKKIIKKTLWLSSQYGYDNFKARLRENPNNYPTLGEGTSEVIDATTDLKGSLVIGSIVELNRLLEKNPDLANALRCGFGDGGVDLISGGPPCQSFSMAGLRRQDCEKNNLPWEFAKFTQQIQPKIVLLENVTGILRPFKDDQGNSYYAWFELAKAFAGIGYVPLCLHTNAKFAGVPQNRPRFILIGIRHDVFQTLNRTFNIAEQQLFSQPLDFFERLQSGRDVDLSTLSYRDVAKETDFQLYKQSFLAPLVSSADQFVSVEDAIDDLREEGVKKGAFSKGLSKIFTQVLQRREMNNHVLRSNNDLVRRRFRLYQVLSLVDNAANKEVVAVLKGEADQLTDRSWISLAEFDYLIEAGTFVRFKHKHEFVDFLKRHPTKKQTQKALLADQPAPAALSIPDDACHYHHEEQRTLTVREMARVQSFPDEFEFRSKVTTGGNQRRFEVPQYTQVGNAVPPLLGRALGIALQSLLSKME
jgi:DNA (cytosine-5)-methyltransferase 1